MIYFIQTTCERGFINIGTARNFQQRFIQLQKACPYRLKAVRTLVGGKAEERELHKRFEIARERGEWFRPILEIVAYIQDTQAQCLGVFPTPEAPDLEHNLRCALATSHRAHKRALRLAASRRDAARGSEQPENTTS